MAVGVWASRDKDRASVRDVLDRRFQDAEFGRIDKVVGEVDGEQRRLDSRKFRMGIVSE